MLMAKHSGIPLIASVGQMVGKRLYGILNAMKSRVSNGNAESSEIKNDSMWVYCSTTGSWTQADDYRSKQ